MALNARICSIVALLLLSWFVMLFMHETGHIIGGWFGGATLIDCDLVPWRMPYSFHRPDPHPLLTVWSGPLLGVVVPTALAIAIQRRWALFVADFCMIANGVYLAVAWITGERLLDTARLFEAGAWPISIATYCVLTIAIGYLRFRAHCIHYLGASRESGCDSTKI